MNKTDLDIFKEIIANNGHRYTKARKDTFNLLNTTHPQSINEILAKAKGSVDRVSVYRNINLFESLGIIDRINIGWKYKLELSDKFGAHHHHMTCLKCEAIVDIEEGDINNLVNEVTEKSNFTATKHIFEIQGYCSECEAR